jgi:hypothetical protein
MNSIHTRDSIRPFAIQSGSRLLDRQLLVTAVGSRGYPSPVRGPINRETPRRIGSLGYPRIVAARFKIV